MTNQFEELGYNKKPAEYFGWARTEMLPFIPTRCRRVLDIGCADGSFGQSLKASREVEVWGVEPAKSAAALATAKLDRVIVGIFGPEIALPTAKFDCILFNDVLEHMFAPELALRYARSLLAPGGVVVASIPNIRSFPTIWQLIIRARWDYQDAGVLDRTHMRFFTKSSIMGMFQSEGFELETIHGINAYMGTPNVGKRAWLAYKIVNLCSFNRFEDMKFQQFAVVAKGE